MSEHTDLLPLRSPEEGGPAFELVRRGYDRDQVENHLGWLEDQLRNAEMSRDAAEHAAASAAAEAEAAREALESGRPLWQEFGDRITQILSLAEEQGSEIRTQRSREADELLTDARQSAADADRTHGELIREAEAKAEQIMSSARAEADRIVSQAQQRAAEEEHSAAVRLAELERQRDAVNAQLTRLHEALGIALAPEIAIALSDQSGIGPAPASGVSLTGDTEYEPAYTGDDYADDTSPSVPASRPVRASGEPRRS
jgi:cell division septum initiation protein DivIVA